MFPRILKYFWGTCAVSLVPLSQVDLPDLAGFESPRAGIFRSIQIVRLSTVTWTMQSSASTMT